MPVRWLVAEQVVTRYLRMLDSDGWKYVYNDLWWKALYKTSRSKLEVYLSLNDDCLTAQAPLSVRLQTACEGALWRYLLRLNNEMRLVKFTLDAEGQLYLSAEVPLPMAAGPAFGDFKAVLTAFRTYFEQFHREVELLAENQTLAEAWLSLLPRAEEPVIQILSGAENT